MLSQIQRFGGAMFTPVLLFPFAGIVVGIAIMLRNPLFVGEALTAPDHLFAQTHLVDHFHEQPVDDAVPAARAVVEMRLFQQPGSVVHAAHRDFLSARA